MKKVSDPSLLAELDSPAASSRKRVEDPDMLAVLEGDETGPDPYLAMIADATANTRPYSRVFPPLRAEITDEPAAADARLARRAEGQRIAAESVARGEEGFRGITVDDLPDRTAGEMGGDMLLRFRERAKQGLALIPELPVRLTNLAIRANQLRANPWAAPSSMVEQPEMVQDITSTIRGHAAEDNADMSMQASLHEDAMHEIADDDRGFWQELVDQVRYGVMNPGVLLTETSGVAGSMAGGGIVPGASVPVNLLVQGLQAGGMNAQEVRETLVAAGATEDEIAAAEAEVFGPSTIVNALLPKAVPGGTAVERAVAGQIGRGTASNASRIVVPTLGEAATEGAAEGIDTILANVATGRDPLAGAGAATGLGTLVGAPMGATAGAADALAAGAAEQADVGNAQDIMAVLDAMGALTTPETLQQPQEAAEAPEAAPAAPPVEEPAPAAAPRARTAAEVGTVIDNRLAELETAAAGALSAEEATALSEEAEELETLLRAQRKAVADGVKLSPANRLTTDEMAQAEARLLEARQKLEAHRTARGAGKQRARLQAKLERIDNDADLAALAESIAPFNPSAEPTIKTTVQETTDGAPEDEVRTGQEAVEEGQEGGTGGRVVAAGVQGAEARRSTAGEDASLTPRAPAEVPVPEGETVESLRAKIAAAKSPAERQRYVAQLGQLQSSQPTASRPAQAVRTRVRSGDTDPDIGRALDADVARRVRVVSKRDDIPEDVRTRVGIDRVGSEGVEGFFDPETGDGWVIEENLDTSAMPRAARKVWVAAHEVAGHRGLRALAASDGDNRALLTLMNRARQNPTVAKLADRILDEYRNLENDQRAAGKTFKMPPDQRFPEEALSELAAAVRTGRYDAIEARYGIEIPQAQRDTIAGFIARLIEAIKRALKLGDDVSDADIYRLIEDAYRAAGGDMPARSRTPTTAPTTATPEATITSRRDPLTDSQKFRNWFGNSKVVDAQGNPLRVYHGSPFTAFEESQNRDTFFSDDPNVAGSYATNARGTPDGAMLAVYLRMEDPIIVEGNGRMWHDLGDINDPFRETKTTNDWVREARRTGRDGVIFRNIIDDVGNSVIDRVSTVYATVRPNQIKSATGNSGEFSLDDNAIVASRRTYDDKRKQRETNEDQAGGGGEAPFSRARYASNPYGEDQGFDLIGLPSAVNVPGLGVVAFHGFEPAQRVAADYMAARGLGPAPKTYVKVDPERAARIATEYEKAKHAPQDPEVKAAYRAMIDETLAQYADILKTGLTVEFIQGEDPYAASPRLAILDVVENNHLWVFPTTDGFGSGGLDVSDNPLLEETAYKISGRTALANDIFRVVHDYFGHIANGVGFRADGEENAWREHSAMYSPLARRAMTSETRGQNSWVNYGPHGEKNRTASAADTTYADQKTTLLPEWVSEEGAEDAADVVASRGWSAKKRQPDAVTAVGVHYSNTPGLRELDPSKAGSAASGRERRRFGVGQFGQQGGTAARVGFYIQDGDDLPPPESIVRDGGGTHPYRVTLTNLYDLDNDPRGLVSMNVDATEEAISDAGFDGFITSAQPGIDGRVAVVFDIGKKKIPVQEVEGVIASRRTPQQANAQRNTMLGKLAANGFALGSPTQQQPGGRFLPLRAAATELRRVMQDKMLPVLRVQQRAGAVDKPAVSSVTLDDAMNTYRMENLMHGRTRDRIEKADADYVLRIQRMMKNTGLTVEQLSDYLLARHAPERNARIAQINAAKPDAGSGISTQQAQDILAGRAPGVYSKAPLSPEMIRAATHVAAVLDTMRDETLKNLVHSGQITQQLATTLKQRYPNYIPLRGREGDDDSATRGGTGRGVSVTSSGLKRALGRTQDSFAQNILGEMVGDLQRSIVTDEKSKVGQAFLKFALANPMPDVFTVEPVDLEWKFSEATGEAYLGVRNSLEDADTTMIVRHNGEPVRIRFEDETLAKALVNLDAPELGIVLNALSALNRWRSAVLTRYNPGFAPVNMTRDALFGITAISAEKGAGTAAAAAVGYPSALRAMWRDARNKRGNSSVPHQQKSWDDWARLFAESGGKTGITKTDDVLDLQRKMVDGSVSLMKLAADGKAWPLARESVKRSLVPALEVVEDFNDASENALRLAVFRTLVMNGEDVPKAAEYAKNVTINFNRKGEAGPLLNAIYLFYNAAMQGSHAVFRVMRNPKVAALLGGLAGMQFMFAASMMDDDDEDGITSWDKVPDYVKRTSLVIPLGWKTGNPDDYFALPMPYGFNMFPYAGGRTAQWMEHGRRKTDSSLVGDVAASTVEAFSPVPLTEGSRSIFGDTLGFLMGLYANTDDFGNPIVNDRYAPEGTPKALLGRADTPRAYHALARALAMIGGGDMDKRIAPVGPLDIAPEQIEALVSFATGGVGSILNRTGRLAEQSSAGNLDGAMEFIAATPIANRFLSTGDDNRAIAERYYGEAGELRRGMDVLKERVRSGGVDVYDETMDELTGDDPIMRGIEMERYRTTSRHGQRGQPKLTETGAPRLVAEDGSPLDTFKSSERTTEDINRAIRRVRTGGLTKRELSDIGISVQVTVFDGAYNGDERATAGDIARAVKRMQNARAEAQQNFLRSVRESRRGQ